MTDQSEGRSPRLCGDKRLSPLRRDVRCLSADSCGRPGIWSSRHGQNRVRQTVRAMEPVQTLLARTVDHLHGRSAADGLYPYRPLTFASAPLDTSLQECRTVFYTPPVSASVARIEKEVLTVFAAFSYLVEAANQHHQGKEEFLVTRRFSHVIELLIVDEANRLKDAGLELIRDFADRGEFGLVLLGMPGLEKRLMRAPATLLAHGFCTGDGAVVRRGDARFSGKAMEPSSQAYSDDFTNKEAVAAIVRITRGNIRLIERLMMQVEHVLVANQLQVVTKEVVETARQNLIIGD